MNGRWVPAAAVVAVGAACRAPAASYPSPAPPATVLLVSFDGLGADMLDRPIALPNLRRLARDGVRAEGLVPAYPTKTFPNHWTLVTGLRPGRHGVVASRYYDPALGAEFSNADTAAAGDARWFGGVPVWALAERAGVRTAVALWPGSESPAGGARPSRWMRFRGAPGADARVDSVAAWLRLPAAERPRLVAAYFNPVDEAGHDHGPGSAEADSAVVEADRLLGRLLGAVAASPVRDRTDVVVVSDHGLAPASAARAVNLSGCAGRGAWAGRATPDYEPQVLVWLAPGLDAERARSALDACLAQVANGAHARAYARPASPARWALRGQPRAGDLIVAAGPGWLVSLGSTRDAVKPGNHGWDAADDPRMRGVFLAAGPHVAAARLPAVDNVHVAPAVARLLGVAWPAGTDGDPRALGARLVRRP